MEKTFVVNGKEIKLSDFKQSGEAVSFVLDGKSYAYKIAARDGLELVLDRGTFVRANVSSPNRDGESTVIANGSEALVSLVTGKKPRKSAGHAGGLSSPMPGKIFKVIKDVGALVKKGETILILEAMKMEHSIRADKDGTVKKINYSVGALVQGGVVLAELE
jgi:biotin carboxyl carrier protein